MADPLISVIICSYNRLDNLRRVIAAMTAQLPAEPGTELIVVDDGSSDGTAPWLQSHPAFPGVTYICQSNRGLSAARNRGLATARGQWMAYLDDDALPAPDWLVKLAECCRAASSHVGVIGGPIRLQWPGPIPTWLPGSLQDWLTSFEPSGPARDSNETPLFRGANMTCRRSAL